MEWSGYTGPALRTRTGVLGYRELSGLVDRRCAELRAAGVVAGEPVVLCLPNSADWVVTYLALGRMGAVSVALNALSAPGEVAHVLSDCGARLALVSPALVRALSGSLGGAVGWWPNGLAAGPVGRAPVRDIPAASVAYTSGTTGRPKGALQTRAAVDLGGTGLAGRLGLGPGAIVATALPLAHTYGTNVLNAVLAAGGTLRLLRRFDERDLLTATRGARVLAGVPAMHRRLLSHPGSRCLKGVRCVLSAGQSAGESLAACAERRTGGTFVEGWGMTELAGMASLAVPREAGHAGTCGTALPGVRLRVASPGPDGVGELEVSGSMVTPGYLGVESAPAPAPVTPDGFLRTGDLGVVDASGRVRIVGRAKEVIVTGGYNVYPAEVERVLSSHPDVAEVAVGALPDPVRGEITCAWVVTRKGCRPTPEQLVGHCRPHLATYKLPRRTVFLDALPLLPNGKIARSRLPDHLEGRR